MSDDDMISRLIQARILVIFAAGISFINGLVIFGAVGIPREIPGVVTFGLGLWLWVTSEGLERVLQLGLRVLAVLMAVWLGFLAFYH